MQNYVRRATEGLRLLRGVRGAQVGGNGALSGTRARIARIRATQAAAGPREGASPMAGPPAAATIAPAAPRAAMGATGHRRARSGCPHPWFFSNGVRRFHADTQTTPRSSVPASLVFRALSTKRDYLPEAPISA
ncbi:MAG: hypothetical protein M3441_20675 [Chloroflexota bacterium]|nr:hypothetical protein [Chloroflexota bacterium]